jgi:aminopeptidase N
MRLRTACSLLALAAAVPAVAAPVHHRASAGQAAIRAPALPPLDQRNIPTQLPRTVRPAQYVLNIRPDPEKLAFSGTATIDIDVFQPVAEITLNALDMQFHKVTLAPLAGGTRPVDASNVRMDEAAQTATMSFPSSIRPGRYRLVIDYRGKIYQQAAGLFALDYDVPEGHKRALFTQFEASDARRFFPSWDEPRFRTPYALTVTVPAGNDVVGNMPAASSKPQPNGMKSVTFMTTPPMASYLLFFATGEFDRITTRAGNTEIGVVTRRGHGEQGRWALASAASILPWYNNYFGTPFPLPKLDNVAGPGSSQFFGAMENWGAIFTFENVLLLDPSITSESARQSIFAIAAHEMAHQWFGDLVTMAWWDDIWLNEGFASWMATKSTAALHPEWEPELGLVGGRESAMTLDSVATTHPVVQHITTVDQMSQAFDTITYEKGEAVITMLENYVGSDAWRRGIQAYIRGHRLSNAQSDDLWAAIKSAAHKPITAIAHDFTLQPGVPLIRIENAACRGGRTMLTLRQAEFTRDRPDKAPARWRVPVIAASLDGGSARAVVDGGSGDLDVPGCGTILVNSGQTGYYRTLYTPEMLRGLTRAYARLKPIDQIGLVADNWGLGLAGYESPAPALDMVDAAPAAADPALVQQDSDILLRIYRMYSGDAVHQAMVARYASAKLGPVLQRIGWRAQPNEPAPNAVLRAALIGTLGDFGDPAVVAEANRLYAAGDPLASAGPLRTTILGVVARNLDAAGWDRLHTLARAEHNPLVRAQLYRMLGDAQDPALAQRALDLALTDEPGPTTSPNIVAAVASQHPDLAFDFALAHRERVESLVDSSSRSRYLPLLAISSSDPAMIGKLETFASQHMTPESRRPADMAIASIRDRARIRETRLPEITRWFEAKAR